LVVEEAGGCVVNRQGQPLSPGKELTDRFSVIAAATKKLADEIVIALR